MKAQASSGTVCAPLLIYMVAGSYWCPSLLAGGLRVDPRAQEPGIAVTMTDAFKNNNAVLPPWPGEQPKTSTVKEWWVAAKPGFTPDQIALYGRTEARGLLEFTAATVPDALPLVTADNGMTESTRQSRLALIMTITDANDLKARKRAAFTSEIAQSMFDALDRELSGHRPRFCGQSSSGSASSLLLLSIASTGGRLFEFWSQWATPRQCSPARSPCTRRTCSR